MPATSPRLVQPRTPPGGRGGSVELLAAGRRSLAAAALAPTPAGRFVAAHLAALRCAAAVLAAAPRSEPPPARRRAPRSVWAMLPAVAPQLAEWAAYFAAGAGKRAAAEAGLPHAVSQRDADDLLRDAEAFLAAVEALLGIAHQAPLPPAG